MSRYSRLVIAGTHSGVGKTTATLHRRDRSSISKSDGWMLGEAADADLSIIGGMMYLTQVKYPYPFRKGIKAQPGVEF